ncbi:hypothetical protein L1887_39626 [Cichorium endivia]|nr:hypothetical protein L1887_39626 [Cichorium endivia]
MEATAIATIAFIFLASALTVLITLCYKHENHEGSSHQRKRHHRGTVVLCRGQTNRDIETGDGMKANREKNVAAAAVASTIMADGGGGC